MDQNFYKTDSVSIVSDENGLKFKILAKLRQKVGKKGRDVVYGIYNNSNADLKTRIQDFLIDNSKVSLKEKAIFFRLLFQLIDSGVPINESLKILIERTDSIRFSRVINTMLYYVEGGLSLSDAMKRFQDVFDESEVGIVRSGEQSAKLKEVLKKLSYRLEERNDLFSKLFSAALYPIIVLSVLLIVMFILLGWVFPSLIQLFKDSGVETSQLPAMTRFILVLQNIIVGYWWAILIFVAVLVSLFFSYKSTDYGRMNWDLMKLKIPLVGKLLKKIYVYRFVDLLSLLSFSFVPLLPSLEIVSSSYNNLVYKLVVDEMVKSLKEGGKISTKALEYSEIFPFEVGQMLKISEKSASISEISEKIADQYKSEIDMSLKRLTTVFEPVLIMLVGFIVAILALAIMGPIFNLGSLMGV